MNKLGAVTFGGKSGNRYKFDAYPLGTVFEKAFSGVYVVTQRKQGKSERGFVHKKICTGQSDDLRQLLSSDDKSLSARGANCICVHAENDKDTRHRIEQDLIPKPQAGNA